MSLHGEFVVPDGAGGYTTELTQTGTLTAVSPTSITVRSEDGYSQTYVITERTGQRGRAVRRGQPGRPRDTQRSDRERSPISAIRGRTLGPGGPGAPPHRN
jgi:hypothetical protein